MDYKISVIIPVYNTVKYLGQCVNSVLTQTYENLEIILVDDGSSDESPLLCDQYEKEDSRIKVIHQNNGGLSKARNTGIREAKGAYVLFLDSDDYWDSPVLAEKLVGKLREYRSDIVNFRYKFYFEDTGKYADCLTSYEEDLKGMCKEEALECLLDRGLYITSACNKMVRREFIEEHQLYFREGITSEDMDWCARMLLDCKSVDYCNMDAYIYRQRSGSITHTVKFQNIQQLSENIRYCLSLGKGLKKEEKMYGLYYTFVAYQYGVFLVSNHYAKDKRVKSVRREMKEYRWLLYYRTNKKVKFLYWLNKCFGYAGMNGIMSLYARVR